MCVDHFTWITSRRWKQETHKVEARVDYTARSCLGKKKKSITETIILKYNRFCYTENEIITGIIRPRKITIVMKAVKFQ